MFDVPDLHDAPVGLRGRQHALRLGQRGRDRFFNQQMAFLPEQWQRNLLVFVSWHHDGDRFTRRAEFLDRREPTAAMPLANLLRTFVVRFVDAHELHIRQCRINARVMLPERPDAHDAAFDLGFGGREKAHGDR